MSFVFVVSRGILAHRARCHLVSVVDHQVGMRGHVVPADHLVVLADLDRRLLLLVRRVDDDPLRESRHLVDVFVNGDGVDDVLVPDRPLLLRED